MDFDLGPSLRTNPVVQIKLFQMFDKLQGLDLTDEASCQPSLSSTRELAYPCGGSQPAADEQLSEEAQGDDLHPGMATRIL